MSWIIRSVITSTSLIRKLARLLRVKRSSWVLLSSFFSSFCSSFSAGLNLSMKPTAIFSPRFCSKSIISWHFSKLSQSGFSTKIFFVALLTFFIYSSCVNVGVTMIIASTLAKSLSKSKLAFVPYSPANLAQSSLL